VDCACCHCQGPKKSKKHNTGHQSHTSPDVGELLFNSTGRQPENLPVNDGDGKATVDAPQRQPENLPVDNGDDEVTLDTPEYQPQKYVNDRAFRMRRRRRLALRRKMLSFEPPSKVVVFQRIDFIPDFSDEEAVMSCDESHDSEQSLDKVMPPDPIVCEQKAFRKRKRDEASWKHNKIEAARQAGLGYVNYRGKEIPPKELRLGKTLCGWGQMQIQVFTENSG